MAGEPRARFKWAVLIALCSGQFVMVLDSTVMNVSIQRVIEDLGTKVSTMQLAIATYTLTTAALMLVGGKVGDIIADAPLGRARPRLDVTGALLSTAGLALAVLVVVQASTWGWITPKEVPSIGGTAIEPFGLSLVPFLIVAGLILIASFAAWERRLAARGGDTLVDLAMLRLPQLRAGLGTIAVMFFCLGGIFFLMPLYLQIVLGKDPLETGVRLLPMSLAVLFVAMGASRLSTRVAPRLLIRLGFLFIAAGAGLLVLTIDPDFDALPFAGSVLVVGIGLGLIGSQVSNVNLSTAGPDKTSETGALQGTGQNLGAALGTAVIGSILLSFLTAPFDHRVEGDKSLPYQPRHQIREKTSEGLAFIPAEVAGADLKQKGVPAPVISQLESNYAQSQVDALKIAVGAVALVALLGFAFVTRRLPATPLRGPPSPTA